MRRQRDERTMKKGVSIEPEKVAEILKDIRGGKSNYKEIASNYGISHQTVSKIAIDNGIRKRPPYSKGNGSKGPADWDSKFRKEWRKATKRLLGKK